MNKYAHQNALQYTHTHTHIAHELRALSPARARADAWAYTYTCTYMCTQCTKRLWRRSPVVHLRARTHAHTHTQCTRMEPCARTRRYMSAYTYTYAHACAHSAPRRFGVVAFFQLLLVDPLQLLDDVHACLPPAHPRPPRWRSSEGSTVRPPLTRHELKVP